MDLTSSRARRLAPVRLLWRGDRLMAELCLIGAARFTAPFFDDQVNALFTSPLRRLAHFEVGMDELARSVEHDPPVPLRGLVFHMSRCGSTLLAQQLAALPGHVALSEPGVLDMALELRGPRPISDDERLGWVRTVVGALTRRRHGERAAFIKLSPSAVLHAELLRRAFPEVPRLFVFREPLAVMASNLEEIGARSLPGVIDPALLGMRHDEAYALSHEDYLARLLARMCEVARVEGLRLLDYADLSTGGIEAMASTFGLQLSDDDRARMLAVARRDAKAPHATFVPKQRVVSEACRAATARWLAGPFAQMKARA